MGRDGKSSDADRAKKSGPGLAARFVFPAAVSATSGGGHSKDTVCKLEQPAVFTRFGALIYLLRRFQ